MENEIITRSVPRFFVHGRGFSTKRRAYEYLAKRELNQFGPDRPYGQILSELFPLDSCPVVENITCSDYGRQFCYCQFKQWLAFRGSQLMADPSSELDTEALHGWAK